MASPRRTTANGLGYLLFPVLVGLVIPYLLIGLVGAGIVVRGVTRGMLPDTFAGLENPAGQMMFVGAIPPWLTSLVICSVVLFYVFFGGVRSVAWANAFQTIVFMVMGVVAFYLIADALGGVEAASETVARSEKAGHLAREGLIGHGQFLSYAFIPLSVGMFPHLFQHWLTARSAKTFRLTTVAHPIFIMLVWMPCILIGIWAAGHGITAPSSNAILARMVGSVLQQPLVTGLLTAGILAAIMSSLDSQFVCLGSMFSNDIVVHAFGKERFSDKQKILLGRLFVVGVVVLTFILSLFPPPNVFDLGVWCFSGFASLFPIVFASLYWRRVTKAGAIASILVTITTWSVFFYRGLIVPTMEGIEREGEYLIFGLMPVAIIFAASAATLVLVSFVTQPPRREVVDRFFP